MVRRLAKQFSCPTEFTLQVLGGKWKTVILAYMKEGAFRYGELRALLPQLSNKVLTERLRELEQSGLITRSSSRGSSGNYYCLTKEGETLRGVLSALYEWGDHNAAAFGVKVGHPLRTRPAPQRGRVSGSRTQP